LVGMNNMSHEISFISTKFGILGDMNAF